MSGQFGGRHVKLSVVIPCYNEEGTLRKCVDRVMSIGNEELSLEVVIVDDCSTDGSHGVALEINATYPEVIVLRHEKNQGKGAALRTGFSNTTGDFVAVQDADLEYDPEDLKRLLVPLANGDADVVLGSRFLFTGAHRVLYFWHSLGNRLLTFLSNMFTDLNLTDMESCYKVFRRDVIQSVKLKENRFGFEPEIIAKISQMRLRIYEMGISYRGRTYGEGKKIGAKDGLWALVCIIRYNSPRAPVPIQFLFYILVGAGAAAINLLSFSILFSAGAGIYLASATAFVIAAVVNYLFCISLLFRHRARWSTAVEMMLYIVVVILVGAVDLWITVLIASRGGDAVFSKFAGAASVLVLNYLGRRYWVFPEPSSGPWAPQTPSRTDTQP